MAGRRGALQLPKGIWEWCGFLWLVARMQTKREVATTPRHSILHLTVGAQQARGYSTNASGWRASAHEGEGHRRHKATFVAIQNGHAQDGMHARPRSGLYL